MISPSLFKTLKANTQQQLMQIRSALPQVLVVTLFLSYRWLLEENVGMVNEVDILPFARHHMNMSWVANDWYLNQPAGYRLPFIAIFGTMANLFGFLTTSIVGRFLCYGLIASGLVALGRSLKLTLLLLLVAVALFLYPNPDQGAIAYEWMVGGIEPKVVAYGCLLWAIVFLLRGHWRWMALWMGLATSFHTLVGGWAFLAALGCLAGRRNASFWNWQTFGTSIALYLMGSYFSIAPIFQHLSGEETSSDISTSFLYVFVRSPHHLNPLSWSASRWERLAIYLALFAVSVGLLWWKRARGEASGYKTRMELAQFTLFCLVPFAVGVAIAPFDQTGRFLQYYPFRVGDLLLPLNTCLLGVCALEQTLLTAKTQRIFNIFCMVLLSIICTAHFPYFKEQVVMVQQFPGEEQDTNAQWSDMCRWIRLNTPQNATIASPPVEFVNFSWLAERATIAKFKLMPPTKVGVNEWLDRLSDLSGKVDILANVDRSRDRRKALYEKLTTGYRSLTTIQVKSLMSKYQAMYFVTEGRHRLDLPIVYRNDRYILYQNPIFGASPDTPIS